ncbi:hypothetical protein L208DRAFT_1315704 [Tricholoma matsutake]|nr:hypothetical protein L208DRAFT_1315704 [Tricholoma matsutake 945]
MIHLPQSSRQPHREAWTRECLLQECAITIVSAIEPRSVSSYSFVLNSYINSCSIHDFPIKPTPDTLSLYVVFMCHHIKPKSVDFYLLGICNQLEPFFPEVHCIDGTDLSSRQSRLGPSDPSCKCPLTQSDLITTTHALSSSLSYNYKLFIALLLTGFHGLLHLGELVWPDHRTLQDYQKIIMCNTVHYSQGSSSYHLYLPGHKANCFFEGNDVIIQGTKDGDNPLAPVRKQPHHLIKFHFILLCQIMLHYAK